MALAEAEVMTPFDALALAETRVDISVGLLAFPDTVNLGVLA